MFGCKPEEIILHGEITGIVTDAETSQPLDGATLLLNPLNETTSTGNDGKYLFKSLTPGSFQIKVTKQNYAERTNTAAVTSAHTTDVNIELDAIPAIHYSKTTLDFGFNLTSESFTISKTGPGEVAYIFTPSKNWININPMSGNLSNEKDSVIVTLNRTGLTQTFINELIIIRSTYLQYIFQDTIDVYVKVHNPIIFNPNLSYGTIADIEGNVYKTIKIGSQIWMAENLRTTRYNDNTPITLVTDDAVWRNLKTPGYCWYNNDEETYKDIYGALYNWFTVNTGILCPIGWHVPANSEWIILYDYLGGSLIAGGKMKETGLTHWQEPNLAADNSSGFTALPGSFRVSAGYFSTFAGGDWWTSTLTSGGIPYNLNVEYDETGIYIMTDLAKTAGVSVRCIENE